MERVCSGFVKLRYFSLDILVMCVVIRLKDNGELNLGKFFTLKFCKLWIKVWLYTPIYFCVISSYRFVLLGDRSSVRASFNEILEIKYDLLIWRIMNYRLSSWLLLIMLFFFFSRFFFLFFIRSVINYTKILFLFIFFIIFLSG